MKVPKITDRDVAVKIPLVADCSIQKLKDTLAAVHSSSITAQTFKVLENTQGISCQNYLPWQDEFHLGGTGYIDGIKAEYLEKPVMWGIDRWGRVYIAIKYICDRTQTGAVAFFQRYPDTGQPVVYGGHFQAEGCRLGRPLDPIYTMAQEFLGNLTLLFKGQDVVVNNILDRVSILNLAK